MLDLGLRKLLDSDLKNVEISNIFTCMRFLRNIHNSDISIFESIMNSKNGGDKIAEGAPEV